MRRSRCLVVASSLLTVVMVLLGCSEKSTETTTPGTGSGDKPGPIEPVPTFSHETAIYMVDVDKERLVPVTVGLPEGSLEEQIRAVVKELASAEETDSRVRCIPAGSALRNVAVEDGTAILDFDRGFTDADLWSGSGTESLRVWGLVNSVTELRNLRKVRVLSEGEAIESLGGHVELTDPLPRDASLIESG